MEGGPEPKPKVKNLLSSAFMLYFRLLEVGSISAKNGILSSRIFIGEFTSKISVKYLQIAISTRIY